MKAVSNAMFPTLKNPFILAPMAGITDDPFRRLCLEQGAALVYSEMVSAKALHYSDAKSLELLRHTPGAEPIAYQLFGSEPEIMAEAAEKLDALEASPTNAIATSKKTVIAAPEPQSKTEQSKIISCATYDINMGCPVPKVAKNGEGSALMRDPGLAARIVEAMTRATGKPVTVKIRAGWDADSVNAVDFARAMEQAGAAAVAVHGRTREQYYSGKADWGIIAQVKEAVHIPVIGSGDVMSGEDAVRMLSETGCDYVMIARGALGNPWIFAEALDRIRHGEPPRFADAPDSIRHRESAPRPTPAARAEMFVRHARLLEADKGEYIAVREMRKHAGWYFKGTAGVTALRAKVNAITSIAELIAAVGGMV